MAGVGLSDDGATVVRLHQIGMRYGVAGEVLRDVDLVLRAGSFHFLVGPSGAGKTSLLRLLSLSYQPSRGTVSLFGRDVSKLGREEAGTVRRRIGVVFQDLRLIDHLSAFENVALPLRIAGASDIQIASYVSEMLGWLGLGEMVDAKPKSLSMGQRQLVAVARAVVCRPSLLLADEPTSNLDPARAERLMHLFVQLHKLGTAVVFATHSQELLRRYTFPVLRMEAGCLAVAAEPTLGAAE
ncbi:MAG TPA: ATP-binding cassette domain-containing protein [Geminicoccaceae bacterium]|nr:ATP-binding cassette domain-containing protein [Geminicoccus sp.]HMU48839.1 ATP-binding cassette domain-containing protein [Geminicoccaceae bacterium]